ncbi:MAG: glycerol-3-phosphate acyltransferase [Candidatus Desulfovibrio kirbyi]|jgi:glycerol-3-phosphate acyltransferase PlsY|uniref:Glycerol-3-phosphate acyltransferase n=1 Tax=Candidatus Desulfovibrio kirbyi TaxID=2696086 RepID=A0A6L2R5X5_9BACT|nr:glycerol-3-phosphate 1-O-acyltransferase PlsY [Desulfovibrio sp.]GFH62968.1 MAG: glycerol-3-phosphate acyltransferase [Candidatus Desulfovibrio kirbyi]
MTETLYVTPLMALWLATAYALGSAPWGLVIAKTCSGIDPRGHGSGNTGATNVARLCGFGYGAATLVCDVLKGAVAIYVALRLNPAPLFVSLAGLCAVCGHVFSCFMRFKGGKAVATSIGVFLPLAFCQLLTAALLCLAVIWRFGYVSLGSLTLVTALPILLATGGYWQWLPLSLGIFALVAFKHRENITRLRAGTEKSWRKAKG